MTWRLFHSCHGEFKAAYLLHFVDPEPLSQGFHLFRHCGDDGDGLGHCDFSSFIGWKGSMARSM